MSQPVVKIRVADAPYVFKWMKQMFAELRLLKKNKIQIDLIRPDDGGKPFIEVKRRG